ncbi:hypothetical protein [Aureibacillus halotolerans]|uniref:hypothetical protein n=1 Tax=Aureibacillus halotolerans TaxID=1508390 RepID=UPI001415055A|nr:hypothetical protein [Aureibacillus halotolerans]
MSTGQGKVAKKAVFVISLHRSGFAERFSLAERVASDVVSIVAAACLLYNNISLSIV